MSSEHQFQREEGSDSGLVTKQIRFLNGRKGIFIVTAVALAVGIGVGILIGHFAIEKSDSIKSEPSKEELGPCLGPDVPWKIIQDANTTIAEKLKEMISAARIRENLKSVEI